MIEHLIAGAARGRVNKGLVALLAGLGAASFAAHSGRAMLFGPQAPSAFAAVTQVPAIAALDGSNAAANAPTRGVGRGRGSGSSGSPGDRPASFGVASAIPLNIGGGGAMPNYRPEIATASPFSQEVALNFVPPDDILPGGGGGGTANAAVTGPTGNTGTTPAVPEPGSILLSALGMAVLGGIAWRRGRVAVAKS